MNQNYGISATPNLVKTAADLLAFLVSYWGQGEVTGPFEAIEEDLAKRKKGKKAEDETERARERKIKRA